MVVVWLTSVAATDELAPGQVGGPAPAAAVAAEHSPGNVSRTLGPPMQAPLQATGNFGDLRGKYYQRVRAQIPADFVQPGLRPLLRRPPRPGC